MSPATLYRLVRRAAGLWSGASAETHGAALAFYAAFSLVPLLLIGLTVAGWALGPAAARRELAEPLQTGVGYTAARAIEEVLQDADAPGRGGIALAVGAVLLLYTASGVFGGLQVALNAIWEAKAARPGLLAIIRGKLLAILMVLGSSVLLLALLIASAALEVAAARWPTYDGLDFWCWVGRGVALAVAMALFALAYVLLPETAVSWRDVWVGAAVTALLVNLGKYLVGWYLSSAGIASAHGAAGSLAVVLVWFYLSAQVFLFGAALTRAYAEHRSGRLG
jgi:membrane protein